MRAFIFLLRSLDLELYLLYTVLQSLSIAFGHFFHNFCMFSQHTPKNGRIPQKEDPPDGFPNPIHFPIHFSNRFCQRK